MWLSQTAEYALRAAAWLAANAPDGPVRATDLARGTGIPLPYLLKILRRLVLAGVLASQKGQRGGFSLARPPSEIRIVDVLAALDAYPQEERCAFGWGDCNAADPCPLHDIWMELNDSVRGWAERTTLAGLEARAVPSGRRAAPRARSARRRR
jgi:Rrf2 family protein